jgi:hypothetical protein
MLVSLAIGRMNFLLWSEFRGAVTPATHRVIIKVKYLRNLDTGLAVIQQ